MRGGGLESARQPRMARRHCHACSRVLHPLPRAPACWLALQRVWLHLQTTEAVARARQSESPRFVGVGESGIAALTYVSEKQARADLEALQGEINALQASQAEEVAALRTARTEEVAKLKDRIRMLEDPLGGGDFFEFEDARKEAEDAAAKAKAASEATRVEATKAAEKEAEFAREAADKAKKAEELARKVRDIAL